MSYMYCTLILFRTSNLFLNVTIRKDRVGYVSIAVSQNSSYQQNSSGSTIYGLPEYHIWITGTLDYRNCVPVTGTVDTALKFLIVITNLLILSIADHEPSYP